MVQVSGLTTPDPLVRVFVVHVYADSALTNLIDVQTAHGIYNIATGGSKMIGYMNFPTLTNGTTYYVVAGALIPQTGIVNWSTPYAVVAS